MKVLLINCSPVRDGATAEIIRSVQSFLDKECDVRSICIDDYDIKFCRGCRSCHTTARCVWEDDVAKVMEQYEWADTIVSVSPSYWADVPGQFKVFIDRCTPWSNTHEPHATIFRTTAITESDVRSAVGAGITGKNADGCGAACRGKKGYTIALRTGSNRKECDRIIETIEHFYGHLEIVPAGSLGLCSVAYKEAVEGRKDEIREFCRKILNAER